MAVKPSGITGAGTSASPYIVHSYDEIVWCCTDESAVPEGQETTDPVYLKLYNDIDCQDYDLSFTWSITLTHAIDFNLNAKTIKTFYIAEASYMFSCPAGCPMKMYNGKILNVYGNWFNASRSVFNIALNNANHYFELDNISFSINISQLSYGVIYRPTSVGGNRCVINECSFWLEGTYSTASSYNIFAGECNITTCDFYLNGITCATTFQNGISKSFVKGASGSGTSSHRSYLLDCRVAGTLDMSNGYLTGFFDQTTLRNCVFDLEMTSTQSIFTPGSESFATNSGVIAQNYGIFNRDKLFGKYSMPTNYIECTANDMDMRVNPNAYLVLQQKGFDVIKG